MSLEVDGVKADDIPVALPIETTLPKADRLCEVTRSLVTEEQVGAVLQLEANAAKGDPGRGIVKHVDGSLHLCPEDSTLNPAMMTSLTAWLAEPMLEDPIELAES